MRSFLILLMLTHSVFAERNVEVLVCLCDNEHQAIAKVGKAIGNGMDPAGNLYWGCSDGLSTYFKKSKRWRLTRTEKPKEGPILITLTFRHHSEKASLIAHAYRGDRMAECIEDFFTKTRDAGKDQLVAFIGHNGMMDNIITLPKPASKEDEASEAIVLGCLTASYFTKPLASMNSEPLVMTKSLMYPGAFILHDTLEIWLKDGSKKELRQAAAKAYAKNQRISVKSGLSIFSEIEE